MASMETRLSQAAAKDAETEWKQHSGMCPRYSRLARDRAAEPCGAGAGLREVAKQLRKVARIDAQLDKAPIEGQGTLF